MITWLSIQWRWYLTNMSNAAPGVVAGELIKLVSEQSTTCVIFLTKGFKSHVLVSWSGRSWWTEQFFSFTCEGLIKRMQLFLTFWTWQSFPWFSALRDTGWNTHHMNHQSWNIKSWGNSTELLYTICIVCLSLVNVVVIGYKHVILPLLLIFYSIKQCPSQAVKESLIKM